MNPARNTRPPYSPQYQQWSENNEGWMKREERPCLYHCEHMTDVYHEIPSDRNLVLISLHDNNALTKFHLITSANHNIQLSDWQHNVSDEKRKSAGAPYWKLNEAVRQDIHVVLISLKNDRNYNENLEFQESFCKKKINYGSLLLFIKKNPFPRAIPSFWRVTF